MPKPEAYSTPFGEEAVEVPDVVTVWDILANQPLGLYDLFLERGFRVPGGRVVWENVRLPITDADDSGDDVVILQRLVPTDGGIRTTERRVPTDTVVMLEPRG
jgi:hypothetical protein